jgi:pimeloyl-ACP methyl ester carboxylesterase
MPVHSIPVASIPVGDQVLAMHDDGTGPAVVLLHGIPGSAASWAPVARLLAADHRVLVPDLLGFGTSSRQTDLATLHARGQAEALDRALDELGIERAVMVGHDFGGPVAVLVHAARSDRVSGLVLAATNAFPDTPIPFPIVGVTWPVIGPLVARVLFSRPSLRMMVRQAVVARPIPVDVDAAVGDRGQTRAIRDIFAGSLRRLAELYQPVEAELARVRVPTRVLWGDHDPFFSVSQGERLAAAISGATFQVVPDAGHFLPEERPDEVAAAIRAVVRASADPIARRT